MALWIAGCSSRESTAARGIERAGGEAVAGARGTIDYVEFAGPATTDATLEQVARELTALGSLTRIQLRDTAVTGSGLKAFEGLSRVRVVDVQGSPVGDEGLASIATLAGLTSLNLARTQVTDAGMASLKSLGKLRILDLSGTTISDASVPHLLALSELRSLNLKGARVSTAGVERLKRAKPVLSVAR